MAQKTIPGLNEIETITENTFFPDDTGTQTFKIRTKNVLDSMMNIGLELLIKYRVSKAAFSNWEQVATLTAGGFWQRIVSGFLFGGTYEVAVAIKGGTGIVYAFGSPDKWIKKTAALPNGLWRGGCFGDDKFLLVGSYGDSVLTSDFNTF